MGELMKVFSVEERRHGSMWVVRALHIGEFREIISYVGILTTSNPDWRIRRVKTPKALQMDKKIFRIPLEEHGHKEDIEWVN